MDKKGDLQKVFLEVSSIVFAMLIGTSVIYFVYSYSNDTSFKALVYAEDIAITLETMQYLQADKIVYTYELPETYEFKLEKNTVIITDENSIQVADFKKEENVEFKYRREGKKLVLEKNELA